MQACSRGNKETQASRWEGAQEGRLLRPRSLSPRSREEITAARSVVPLRLPRREGILRPTGSHGDLLPQVSLHVFQSSEEIRDQKTGSLASSSSSAWI